jgi:hypothetical protein
MLNDFSILNHKPLSEHSIQEVLANCTHLIKFINANLLHINIQTS